MTCTGKDALIMDITQKAEHCADKYGVSFMDVLNRMMEFHTSWIDEEKGV